MPRTIHWRARTGITELDSDDEVKTIVRKKKQTVRIHIFAAKMWHDEYRDRNQRFLVSKISAGESVTSLINCIVSKRPHIDAFETAVTQVFEKADEDGNYWKKGTTIKYEDDAADVAMEELGWTADHGKSLPPIWLCMHHKNIKHK